MSLFGTSPPAARQAKSSLFDDEPGTKSAGSGLFADSDGGEDNAGGSPWDFPNPKKNKARGNVIKTLLPASDVPDAYVDAFDALSAGSGGVDPAQIRGLLASGSVGAAEQAKIIEMIGSSGEPLGRSEFNVLLALIGLAQEGEELSLDAVDERRRKLPIPSLPSFKPPQPNPSEQQPPPAATPTAAPQAASGAIQTGTMRSAAWDSDPWGSPDLHKNHNHAPPDTHDPTYTNGSNVLGAAQRTTSSFTTHPEHSETPTPATFEPSNRPPTSSTSESGWAGYSGGAGDGFDTAPSGEDGFGAPGGDAPNHFAKQLRSNKTLGGVEEMVTVNVLEEKEGMFMFQHRNYEVTSIRRGSKVIRRYSDFVWLLDCLHKRYPFRQLPLLPPKRVAINGKHIAADNLFIEKRRRGLARFANALVRHPVLREEQLVVMFLTVPTVDELAVWRKQATISVQEEFTGKSLPPGLEDSLPSTLSDLFDQVRSGVRRSTEIYINLCNMTERLTKHNWGLSAEYNRLSISLQGLVESSSDTYAIDNNEVPLLNNGIGATAKHLSTNQSLLEDEARAWDLGILEDLKRQRDALVSMRDMFDRRDKYSKDNIPQLERRIANNESKLSGIRAKPEQKPGEAEKVEDAIVKDKQSIVNQHARSVFIKECIRDEILHFQHSQYHISRTHQEWSQERVKYAELSAENWRSLSEELEAMPLGE